MRFVFLIGLVYSFAAASTIETDKVVWVTETKYVCPCTSSMSTQTSSSHLSAIFSPSSLLTSKSVSKLTTFLTTGSTTVSTFTTVSSSRTSTTTSSSAGPVCLAAGADCSKQTVDFGCCSSLGLTCDSTTLTCMPLDSDGSLSSLSTSAATTTIHIASPTTTSSGSQMTCITAGADCSKQTVDFGCCANSGLTCDSTTLTCIPVDPDDRINSSTTTTVATASTTTTTSPFPAGTCIALGADCSAQTATYYCCKGSTCNFGLDTPTCVIED